MFSLTDSKSQVSQNYRQTGEPGDESIKVAGQRLSPGAAVENDGCESDCSDYSTSTNMPESLSGEPNEFEDDSELCSTAGSEDTEDDRRYNFGELPSNLNRLKRRLEHEAETVSPKKIKMDDNS